MNETIEYELEMEQLVSFEVGDARYSLPIDSVLEMTLLGRIETIADAPNYVRGMMRQRDSVIPILDLRRRLGMPSTEEERVELLRILTEHKRQHIEWIDSIEQCCREGQRFEFCSDPKACPFGHWLSRYRTVDKRLSHILDKFEEPHARLHDAGNACLEETQHDDRAAAQKHIDEIRSTHLVQMNETFDQVMAHIRDSSRELVVIIQIERQAAGIAVDRIVSVAGYRPDELQASPLSAVGLAGAPGAALVSKVVKPEKGGQLIQILDPSRLFCDELESLTESTSEDG